MPLILKAIVIRLQENLTKTRIHKALIIKPQQVIPAGLHLSISSKCSSFLKSAIRTIPEMNKMKAILRSEFAASFNTNLLRIALNLGEDRIAAVIVARLPVVLDEQICKFAVLQKSMIFLQ